ncbi:3-oxoacyl-(acyl-carrier-protein) synthase [Robiginitalea myxolifaciens]|uniref:3-oxoacyl-(Acyl-carrier-protein) synthase n=1 Tax=Robiginitalea myxolifaciens TaxID=400055 RepID=A0A1I6G7E9_9FLAO|nr:beta-ketoacyl synthase N-terminal-like domain-containing protein [Robiginitalea myxolifaciens]SFR38109.1 3-oxoacyl-(acyl-carrier-protein) synthase [Robiginitalea myxolifaciens]
MNNPGNTFSIRALKTISALGTSQEAEAAYREGNSGLGLRQFGEDSRWAGSLPEALSKEIELQVGAGYPRLDPTVHYAIFCARQAMKEAGWTATDRLGINIGSSRGATALWEKYHQQQLGAGRVATQASPSTTLGNIASWVAHDLGSQGPAISHSITCSSALHAIINGCAWLQAGFADQFLAGGSEAPLTPFTVSQMEALKIYSRMPGPYPCRSFDQNKTANTMVLGEGAGMVCLEAGKHPEASAWITGIGYATEPLSHGASLSAEAQCLQKAMQMALGSTPAASVEAVVVHAPGTLKGDSAELRALEKVFPAGMPEIFTNKWQLGHTLGASGMLNLELAMLLLEGKPVQHPGYLKPSEAPKQKFKKVVINAVGFGGNAASLLLEGHA